METRTCSRMGGLLVREQIRMVCLFSLFPMAHSLVTAFTTRDFISSSTRQTLQVTLLIDNLVHCSLPKGLPTPGTVSGILSPVPSGTWRATSLTRRTCMLRLAQSLATLSWLCGTALATKLQMIRHQMRAGQAGCTEVMGVKRSILTNGFYVSTDLSPGE